MIGKIFGFIGKWLGYIILGLIGIALFKFFVLPPENPDSLEYSWERKLQRYWKGLDKEYSENPPFYSPQESILCCIVRVEGLGHTTINEFGYCPELGTRDSMIQSYNEFLITEALKGRALLIGGRGEDQRLESITSMSCTDKYDSYFNNFVEPFDHKKIEKLIDKIETD
ncbi:hypothetical protein N8782_00605 [Methylophilaceae bacterium]|nr:hypothetical protein [Methylophilaceae bacterium]